MRRAKNSAAPWALRHAAAADQDAWLALLHAAALPPASLDSATTWLAVRGADLLACASVERHATSCYLRSVAVDARQRGAGLGTRLCEQALASAARAGAEEAWLMTTDAEGFFARRGFVPVAREEAPPWLRAHGHLIADCPSSATLMRRAPASPGHLFVYGTLRRGQAGAAAQRLAGAARWLGPARLPGRVQDLGDFPAARDPSTPDQGVDGEIYALPADPARRAALLAELDAYERTGPQPAAPLPFERRQRLARLATGPVLDCAVYLWIGPLPRPG